MILPVIIAAALTCAFVAAYAVLTRSPEGRHARPREGRHELTDPADQADPDGSQWLAQVRPPRLPACGLLEPVPDTKPGWLDEDELDAGWWAQSAPPGGWALPGDGPWLTRLPGVLRDWQPGEDTPDPPATGEIPALLADGTITPSQAADHLAAKYLTTEVPR